MTTFRVQMAEFGRRLYTIAQAKNAPALQELVLDMCKYRDDMTDADVADYRLLSTSINVCNGALWSLQSKTRMAA